MLAWRVVSACLCVRHMLLSPGRPVSESINAMGTAKHAGEIEADGSDRVKRVMRLSAPAHVDILSKLALRIRIEISPEGTTCAFPAYMITDGNHGSIIYVLGVLTYCDLLCMSHLRNRIHAAIKHESASEVGRPHRT